MSRTVAISTLGCKTNQFESAAMEERLKNAGYVVIPFEQGASLVIVNTCTVTSVTDSQSRNLIRRARRLNPQCRVVVTGCYAQVDPEALSAIPGVSLVLGNDEKEDFLQLLQSTEDDGTAEVIVSDIRVSQKASAPLISSFADRSRAFVQIQNGCDAFCSYCIIPYARGRSRSVPPEQVFDQVRQLVKSGYGEVVLTGIHIGGYGADLDPSINLLDLVKRIEDETDLGRLRLGSLEPTEIPDALIERVATSSRICPHFHIPLQSGDDQVLQRMNRHYDRDFFRNLVHNIIKQIPEAAIGLDVITGFPQETEAEFENTFSLIQELPISHLHVFPYSRRPGTPAASMDGQLPGNLVKERAARLRSLGEEKNYTFCKQFVGQTLDLVIEAGETQGLRKGLSRNYLGVRFESPGIEEGRVVQVFVESFVDGELRGRLV